MIILLVLTTLDLVIGLGQTISPDATCSLLKCGERTHCQVRFINCTYDGCPTMEYCVAEDIEELAGPSNCDKVICSPGYSCVVTLQQQSPGAQTVATCLSDSSLVRDVCSEIDCPEGSVCEERSVDECLYPPCLSSVPVCVPNVVTVEVRLQTDTPPVPDVCRGFHCPEGYVCQESPTEFCAHPPCSWEPECVSLEDLQNMTRSEENSLTVPVVCHGFHCPEGMDCHERPPKFCPQPPCDPQPICVPLSEQLPSIQTRQYPQTDVSRPRNVCDHVKCAKGGYCYRSRSNICDENGMCRENAWCAHPPGLACLACPRNTHCVYGTLICKDPPCDKYVHCVPWEVDVHDACDRVKCKEGYVCKKRFLECLKKPCRQYTFCALNEEVPHKSLCERVTCPKGTECAINSVKCPNPPCQRYARCMGVKEQDKLDCECPYNSVCRRGFLNCKNPPCPTYLYCDIATVDDSYCNCTEKGICRRGWLDCKSPPCPYYFYCGTQDPGEVVDGCRGLHCGDGYQCHEETDEDCRQPPCKLKPVCVALQQRMFVDELDNPPLTGGEGVCANFQCPKGSDCHEKRLIFCPAPPCPLVPVCIPVAVMPPVDPLPLFRRSGPLPALDQAGGLPSWNSLSYAHHSSIVAEVCRSFRCPPGTHCHPVADFHCPRPPCLLEPVCFPNEEGVPEEERYHEPPSAWRPIPEVCENFRCPEHFHCHENRWHCQSPYEPCEPKPYCVLDYNLTPGVKVVSSPESDTWQVPEVCRGFQCPEGSDCHETTVYQCPQPPCPPVPVCVRFEKKPFQNILVSQQKEPAAVPEVCRGFQCPEGYDCHEKVFVTCPQPPCPSLPVCVPLQRELAREMLSKEQLPLRGPWQDTGGCQGVKCANGSVCVVGRFAHCPNPPCLPAAICVPERSRCHGFQCPEGSVCQEKITSNCSEPPCLPEPTCITPPSATTLNPSNSTEKDSSIVPEICRGFHCPEGSVCFERTPSDCAAPPCTPVATCIAVLKEWTHNCSATTPSSEGA